MITILAVDTATEYMSIALTARGQVWAHDSAGGALASAQLIPTLMALLKEAQVTLYELDAIAFGRGPGAFTGLRTACSVVQGLALGAHKPVLPIDSLLAVAQDAFNVCEVPSIWVTMDARMNEIYAAHYVFEAGDWKTLVKPFLTTAAQLNDRWQVENPQAVAGNALSVFAGQLQLGAAREVPQALPRAQAMLSIAQKMWEQGAAVDAALALPLYVRDNVALTTAQREAQRSEQGSASG